MVKSYTLSPGHSWYEDNVFSRPVYPCLTENKSCDVAIIGGGFTGLSAAYHLAKAGLDIIVIEADRLGSGASGRNGGQLGTGQRQWVEDLEKHYGYERSKALFDIAEQAKEHLLLVSDKENFALDYQNGHISLIHRKRYLKNYQKHIDIMARYGYEKLEFLTKEQVEQKIGSDFYHGGIRDSGTGHIHPLKAVIGFGKAAIKYKAQIYENTKALQLIETTENFEKTYKIHTEQAHILAKRVLIASNAYHLDFVPSCQKYVVPIRSYIGATESLENFPEILPDRESIDDSRFVVRYFKKTKENILLFGGVENYSSGGGTDVESAIRKQIKEIYPQLQHSTLTHSWGGTVAITVERMPFIRQLMSGVLYCGGYSGHGVILAPYIGKLYADTVLGKDETLRVFQDLKISPFPGGKLFQSCVLFFALHCFSLMDKI